MKPRAAIHGPFFRLPPLRTHPAHGPECAVRDLSDPSPRQTKKAAIVHAIAYHLECDDGSGQPCAICRTTESCERIRLDLKAFPFGLELEVPVDVRWVTAPTKGQRAENIGRHLWPSWIYRDRGTEALETRKRAAA